MKVLVLNAGSSSLKYELMDMDTKETLAKWMVEEVWTPRSFITYKAKWEKLKIEKSFANHKESLQEVFELLVSWDLSVISNLDEIQAVGHRVVHGGESFSESVIINDHVIEEIKACSDLAPLHNPANLDGILACREIMGDIPQVAVFDTAFHQTMQPENYLYSLPYKYYKNYKIRKYGFHGTSHKYVSNRVCEFLDKDIKTQKIITCHIWNWGSLAAIKEWKVVDTSMWFTPLAWITMGTRCGDIDPAIIGFLAKKENLTTEQIDKIMNKESGLLWISEQSSDMRDIETGDAQCQLALDVYVNRIVKYIGSYAAILWWVDAIVFTAGVGERGPIIREKIMEYLSFLGIKVDKENNEKKAEEVLISTPDSKVAVCVIPTEEEMMIANDTYRLVNAIS